VTSDDLPPGVRLDPRPGKLGAQYVLLTCAACGREFRLPLSQVRLQMRHSILPQTCSRACAAELRRRWRAEA
jgi:RNase P subunit RPR2